MKKFLSLVLLFMIFGTGCSFSGQTYHKFNVHYDVAWMPNPALMDPSTPTSLFLGSAEADIELTFPSTGGEMVDQIGAVRITDFTLSNTPCSFTVPDSFYTQEIPVELEFAYFSPANINKTITGSPVDFRILKWKDGAELPPLSVNMECPVVGSIPLTADIYPLVLGVFDEYSLPTTCQYMGRGYVCTIIRENSSSSVTMYSETVSSLPFMDVYLATFTFTLEDLGETTSK